MEDAASLFGLAAVLLGLGAFVHVSVAAWLRVRAADRAQQLPAADATQLAVALQAQLARLEQALEAQSVELERIAESQRYTTRVLTEGSASSAAAPRPPERIVTPQ